MEETKELLPPYSELTTAQQDVVKQMEKRFDSMLSYMGLQTPIDYIFLDFALQKSRMNLSTVTDSLHFLFHTIKKQDLEHIRPFPYSIFIEKCTYRKFDEIIQTTCDREELIMWSLCPTSKWDSRDVLPFTDFHLYFMDVIKPLYSYSVEDIYRLLDERKEDLFFVTHGTRTSHETKRIVTLFVTKDHIVAFHFDPVEVADIPQSEKFLSKWISLDLPISLHTINEFAIFERPKFQIVGKNEEENMDEVTQKINLATPGLDFVDSMDCLDCSA